MIFLCSDLVEEGFDLAIRAGTLPDSSLIARRLGSPGTLRVYASEHYLSEHGTPKHPRDLVEHRCLIMTGQSAPLTWTFQHRGKPLATKVRAHVEANSFVVLGELVARGHGIARLPDHMAADVAKTAPALRGILDAFAPSPVPWHAVYPSSRHLSARVRALIELLELRFEQLSNSRRASARRSG